MQSTYFICTNTKTTNELLTICRCLLAYISVISIAPANPVTHGAYYSETFLWLNNIHASILVIIPYRIFLASIKFAIIFSVCLYNRDCICFDAYALNQFIRNDWVSIICLLLCCQLAFVFFSCTLIMIFSRRRSYIISSTRCK